MRRASTCLAVLGLFVLSLPAMASAEEITVNISKFTAKAVPIPKPGGGSFKGTGNFYGKGAAVEAEYEFEGSGYGAVLGRRGMERTRSVARLTTSPPA